MWRTLRLVIEGLDHHFSRRQFILVRMTLDHILASIDQEIASLQKARILLSGESATAAKAAKSPKKRKPLSAAARKRIADAQRKRWAAQKAKGK